MEVILNWHGNDSKGNKLYVTLFDVEKKELQGKLRLVGSFDKVSLTVYKNNIRHGYENTFVTDEINMLIKKANLTQNWDDVCTLINAIANEFYKNKENRNANNYEYYKKEEEIRKTNGAQYFAHMCDDILNTNLLCCKEANKFAGQLLKYGIEDFEEVFRKDATANQKKIRDIILGIDE